MNIVNKLTVRHLRLNRSRTLITIMGIMLSVAMVCAVAGFIMSLRETIRETIIEGRGDYHIAYIGVTNETAAAIAQEDIFSASFTKNSEIEGMTDVFLRLESPGRDYWEIAKAVGEQYSYDKMSANTELLALDGAIAQDNVMQVFILIGAIAIVIIVAGSVIVIANAFYISSTERVRQFGLLKSAGATKWQIGRSILFEAFLLAVIAIPLGIALGFLIQAVVLQLVNGLLSELNAINTQELTFRVIFSPAVIFISVGIAIITLLISAWLPARRAANTSPIDAIRRTKDIKIRSRRLKTSRLIRKLFGFEGSLASKSLKRSRGKYRATVVSLTASIVLFVSVSSLISVMNKSVQMEYAGYDFDVLIGVTADWNESEEIAASLRTLPDAQVNKHLRIMFDTTVPEGFVSESFLENMTAESRYGIMLHLIPDAEFAKIGGQGDTGILINTTGSLRSGGKLKEATPYLCEIGTELPIRKRADEAEPEIYASVTISALTSEIPAQIPAAIFSGSLINVLVSETYYKALYQYSDAYTFYTVAAADAEAFCAAAEKLIQVEGKAVIIENISQIARLNRNVILIIALFGYGFIAMLSLIAVTSVITTISTGMALRRQEFAMLYSAGMTPGGMNKMLNMESLLYGLKSIVIGLPLALALSCLIHYSISGVAEFAYMPPYFAMAAGSAAVLLLTFGTMRYSRGIMNKVSIVDALRGETA